MSFINAKIVKNGADYHAQEAARGTPQFVMSSSALRAFAVCPSRWKAGYESKDSDASRWGRMLDVALLTPALFEARYVVEPPEYTNDKGEVKPWNNNATVCREWNKKTALAGKEVVDEGELESIDAAIKRVRQDELMRSFLDTCDMQVELSAQWKDEATGLTIPFKCLLDCVPRADTEFRKCLGDLKTTMNAAAMPWQRWCFTAGYHIQAAVYIDAYVAATGEDRNTFCFLLSENFPPYEPGKRMLSQDFLTLGRASYTQMLANYSQCLKSNQWPGYDDTDESLQGWTLVEAEPFMAERAAFAPRYDFDEVSDCPAATLLREMGEAQAKQPLHSCGITP